MYPKYHIILDNTFSKKCAAFAAHPHVDVITLTANGEPTLYPDLVRLAHELNLIKGRAKTLILSNGSGVLDPQICEALKGLDIVKFRLTGVEPLPGDLLERRPVNVSNRI